MTKQELLTKIKKAIKKAQDIGFIYYPSNDDELLDEWGEKALEYGTEAFELHVEINSICGGEWL
jgi:hypothetical protein